MYEPSEPLERMTPVVSAAEDEVGVIWTIESSATEVWSPDRDRKSTRLNSSHSQISYAVFCLKKKKQRVVQQQRRRGGGRQPGGGVGCVRRGGHRAHLLGSQNTAGAVLRIDLRADPNA